jgi:hypothetical protein
VAKKELECRSSQEAHSPHARANHSAQIDTNEPSAVASCNDLANFANRRIFLLGSQERHTTGALTRYQKRGYSDWLNKEWPIGRQADRQRGENLRNAAERLLFLLPGSKLLCGDEIVAFRHFV